jgi:hypothetical protein
MEGVIMNIRILFFGLLTLSPALCDDFIPGVDPESNQEESEFQENYASGLQGQTGRAASGVRIPVKETIDAQYEEALIKSPSEKSLWLRAKEMANEDSLYQGKAVTATLK